MLHNVKQLSLSALAIGIAAAASASPIAAAPPVSKTFLIPHRAVYDLKLGRSHGGRGVDAVRGRILYDFSGNDCEGYALQFRQVSEMDLLEGKSTLSDIRSSHLGGRRRRKRFASTRKT